MSKTKVTKKVSASKGKVARPIVQGDASKKRRRRPPPINKLVNLKLPPEVVVQLTTYGRNNNKPLITVCAEAIEWFVKKHASKPTLMYLSDIPKHELRQYWIPPAAYDAAVVVSERDGVAIRLVVYTALMLYYDSETKTWASSVVDEHWGYEARQEDVWASVDGLAD